MASRSPHCFYAMTIITVVLMLFWLGAATYDQIRAAIPVSAQDDLDAREELEESNPTSETLEPALIGIELPERPEAVPQTEILAP